LPAFARLVFETGIVKDNLVIVSDQAPGSSVSQMLGVALFRAISIHRADFHVSGIPET
jgi:hypothetical protein